MPSNTSSALCCFVFFFRFVLLKCIHFAGHAWTPHFKPLTFITTSFYFFTYFLLTFRSHWLGTFFPVCPRCLNPGAILLWTQQHLGFTIQHSHNFPPSSPISLQNGSQAIYRFNCWTTVLFYCCSCYCLKIHLVVTFQKLQLFINTTFFLAVVCFYCIS